VSAFIVCWQTTKQRSYRNKKRVQVLSVGASVAKKEGWAEIETRTNKQASMRSTQKKKKKKKDKKEEKRKHASHVASVIDDE
jgi:hypothetical protein